MAEEITIRTLRSLSEAESVRCLWASWQFHPNSDIDFYLQVMKLRPEFLRPHILVLFRNGTPDAMLIGRLEQGHIPLRIGYKTLARLPVRQLTFIHSGLLGNATAENCERLFDGVLHSLGEGEGDLAFFNHVRADSPLYRVLKTVPGFLMRDFVTDEYVHRSMRLPDQAEKVYQALSPKVRKNLRWQKNRLLNEFHGQVEMTSFDATSDLDRLFRDVEEVARNTYQRKMGVGFRDTPETRERLTLAARLGRLRGFVLYIVGRPTSFWLGTLYRGVFHSDSMGYDASYAKFSPGMFLIMAAIETFCERRNGNQIGGIDFGLGDAQYKVVLGDAEWTEASGCVFAPTFRGLSLNLVRTPIALANELARKALGEAGFLQKAKTVWRRWLAGRSETGSPN